MEFASCKERDLSDLPVAYLFVDAIHIGMRFEKTRKQAVLLAYATLEDGSFELLSIGLGYAESDASWKPFIENLSKRDLRDPLLTISDGNQALVNALEGTFDSSYRQRCVRHKVENILSYVPKEKHVEVKAALGRMFYGATSLEQAKAAAIAFKKTFTVRYPSAVDCLEGDLESCLTFYLFPANHWRRTRTSNCLERLNLEIRRRLNVIGRHPSEEECLTLVFQIAKRYQENKAGFKANDMVHAQWKRLRQSQEELILMLDGFQKAASLKRRSRRWISNQFPPLEGRGPDWAPKDRFLHRTKARSSRSA